MFGEQCCGVSELGTTKRNASNEGFIDAPWFKISVNAGKGTFGCLRPHPFQAGGVVPILRLSRTNDGNIDHEPPRRRQHLIESVAVFVSTNNLIPA
jgi:hypothetical protein